MAVPRVAASEAVELIDEDFRMISVEPTEPPTGSAGNDWHCYTIGQGGNRIRGYRQGKLMAVTRSVEDIVLRLNERRMGKRGRTQIDMTARRKSADPG